MNALVSRAAAWLLFRSKALALHARMRQRGHAVILTYHSVNDAGDAFAPSLPASVFAAQIALVASHYQVSSLEDAVDWLQAGAEGSARVVLTFDDGYPDTHSVVLPTLRRHGVPGTLFLATAPLETGERLWFERVRHLLRTTPSGRLELPLLGLGPWSLQGDADRLAAANQIVSFLKRRGKPVLEQALAELERRTEIKLDRAPTAVLTWDQVAEMSKAGVSIGAHTHGHHILSALDMAEARSEVERSAALIAQHLGRPAKTFAYPNGTRADYTPEHTAMLRGMGFKAVCTTIDGVAEPHHDPLDLPRLYTTTRTLDQFAVRVSGLGGAASRLRRRSR